MIVFLALMSHSHDIHCVSDVNLKQSNVARGTEWNEKLPQKRILRNCFTA